MGITPWGMKRGADGDPVIAIIDYKAGNLTSVQRALAFLGWDSLITTSSAEVLAAERIIFPGVGAAGTAMFDLMRLNLDSALVEAYGRGKPILGICLGTQIVMEQSEENRTRCLGIIRGEVIRFPENISEPGGLKLKVPHMGWNRVIMTREHPVFDGIDPQSEFYFVHSYYPAPRDTRNLLGQTLYGISFASVLVSANLVAVQFHPEKSGRPGLRLLSNFCRWDGKEHA
jgi:glutamine amidotransferase